MDHIDDAVDHNGEDGGRVATDDAGVKDGDGDAKRRASISSSNSWAAIAMGGSIQGWASGVCGMGDSRV